MDHFLSVGMIGSVKANSMGRYKGDHSVGVGSVRRGKEQGVDSPEREEPDDWNLNNHFKTCCIPQLD